MEDLYFQHLGLRQQTTERHLVECGYDGLVISSGYADLYFADDQEAPFRPTPHFAHWCPERTPHHLLWIRPASKPTLVFFSPADFWYEPPTLEGAFWAKGFDVIVVRNRAERWKALGDFKGHAFIGPELAEAQEKGLDPNPTELVFRLDWERAQKSAYEVLCVEKANEKAALGHRRVLAQFLQMQEYGSELALHLAFLEACDISEEELAYASIIALNEKSAFLHYNPKRRKVANPQTLLIDCGVPYRGYASDITRTYARESTPATFRALLQGLEDLQQALCRSLKAGIEFKSLHKTCHLGVANLLLQCDVLKLCDAEFALQKGLTQVFLPHGLGHMLGLQVHDVAGLQINAKGEEAPPDKEFPKLRTRRALREKEIVTIEPGIYFIPVLLAPHRTGELRSHFDWNLIDSLIPYGGMRIEDNVLVLPAGMRNLTRKFLEK
ncbi:MAG: Xaa-Pro dipeptidase [Oligoflexales bacterium]|nr:Xaa-Pro dipeptidase [Oligoflexales bacterium]